MVGLEKRKEIDKGAKDARSFLRIREDAAYGIGAGMHSDTKGSVNIESVELRTNSQYSAMFAHNPNVERAPTGGLAMLWVMIPKTEEPEEYAEKRSDGSSRLRKLMRAIESDGDLSRN
jgi:hypothetical protein